MHLTSIFINLHNKNASHRKYLENPPYIYNKITLHAMIYRKDYISFLEKWKTNK